MDTMKTLLGMIGFLMGTVLLSGILALPYFRPEQPWPDWLILVGGLVFVFLCVIFWPRHRSPKQILEEYQRLQWQEEEQSATLARAKKEKWRADVIPRMEAELQQLRGRIAALRNDGRR